MAFTICAFVLAASFALASPQCTPDQWEGFQGSLGGYSKQHDHGIIKEYMGVHYDYTNRRSAIFIDVSKDDNEGKYEGVYQIVLREEKNGNRIFVVNKKDESCWTKAMKRPFRQMCLPEEHKYLGQYYMGLSGDYIVSSYLVEKWGMTSYLTVEQKGDVIIPVGESIFGTLGGTGFVQSVGFMNITAGIADESVFDVPEECESKEEITMVEQLTREHYILAL